MLLKQSKPYCVIAAILLLASCATVDQPVPLPEGRWEMSTSSFMDIGRMPGLPRATLQIRNGRVSAYSGCNTAQADVRAADGKMEIGPLAATRRACPEPIGTFEARWFKLLRDHPYFRTENDMLILAAGEHSARFRRIADKPPTGNPPS